MRYLCITVRWLDDRYHGLLGPAGPPEWPPSPYRLFQALVAGVARAGKLSDVGEALRWLEGLPPPLIIAPPSKPGQVVRRFVPNNDADKEPDRQLRLTEKASRPTLMLGEPAVQYTWACGPEGDGCPDEVVAAAHRLTFLGWGIDMAVADAQITAGEDFRPIDGIRWVPRAETHRDIGMLRVPTRGTLDDLLRAHASTSDRIGPRRLLKPPKKPSVFRRVFYHSAEQRLSRPYTLFSMRNGTGDFFRYPQAKLIHVAGMVRHAAIAAMRGYPPPGVADAPKWIEALVAGHRNGSDDHVQFSYLPLPSVGHEHADCDIRRVMIVAPFGEDANLHHLADQLDGCQLAREGGGEAPVLDRLPGDGVTVQYTKESAVWATVTPIILPGHDDGKPAKTRKLLEKALRQSGIEQPCEFTWSAVPNFRHGLPAFKHDRQGRPIGYFRPDHLAGLTAVHARIKFSAPAAGPLAIGAGRHCGLGTLAALDGDPRAAK